MMSSLAPLVDETGGPERPASEKRYGGDLAPAL